MYSTICLSQSEQEPFCQPNEYNRPFSSERIQAESSSTSNELSFSICRILSKQTYHEKKNQPSRKKRNILVNDTFAVYGNDGNDDNANNDDDNGDDALLAKNMPHCWDANMGLLHERTVSSDIHVSSYHESSTYSSMYQTSASHLDTLNCLNAGCYPPVNPQLFSVLTNMDVYLSHIRKNVDHLAPQQQLLLQEDKRQPGNV